MFRKAAALAAIALLGAACSSSPRVVNLGYAAPANVAAVGKTVVGPVIVTDARTGDPKIVGVIRGGYGNPLKTLYTPIPTKDVVADLFGRALSVRGLKAEGDGALRLEVTLKALNSSQYQRREAHVDLTAKLVNTATGAAVFTRDAKADKVAGGMLALDTGIASNPDKLRALVDEALKDAIDQVLDDPAFRAALG